MCGFFDKRGYPANVVQAGHHGAQQIDRQSALQTSQEDRYNSIHSFVHSDAKHYRIYLLSTPRKHNYFMPEHSKYRMNLYALFLKYDTNLLKSLIYLYC